MITTSKTTMKAKILITPTKIIENSTIFFLSLNRQRTRSCKYFHEFRFRFELSLIHILFRLRFGCTALVQVWAMQSFSGMHKEELDRCIDAILVCMFPPPLSQAQRSLIQACRGPSQAYRGPCQASRGPIQSSRGPIQSSRGPNQSHLVLQSSHYGLQRPQPALQWVLPGLSKPKPGLQKLQPGFQRL